MTSARSSRFWQRVLYVDPRILYLVFFLLLVGLEFRAVPIPVPVPETVQQLYDRIELLDGEKLVIVDCSLDSGYIAEGQGQYEAVVEHLFRRGIPFAVCLNTMFSEGPRYATALTDRVLERVEAETGPREYGVDYCIWQAVTPANGATLAALAKNIPDTIKRDVNGTPISDLPMMEGVQDIHDVDLVYRVSYTWDAIFWIGFVQSVYGTPFAVGTSAISSSGAYPFVDSEQICGLIAGASGAAAYERLLEAPGKGTQTVSVQSLSVIYVILAILLGNLAMFMARRGRDEA